MHSPGDQSVHLVHRQHHRAEHNVVFKLLFGLQSRQALGAPQHSHRLDVAPTHRRGVDDLHLVRQRDTLGLGDVSDPAWLARPRGNPFLPPTFA